MAPRGAGRGPRGARRRRGSGRPLPPAAAPRQARAPTGQLTTTSNLRQSSAASTGRCVRPQLCGGEGGGRACGPRVVTRARRASPGACAGEAGRGGVGRVDVGHARAPGDAALDAALRGPRGATEGVYSRDMGRGNSREGGGGMRPAVAIVRTLTCPPRLPAALRPARGARAGRESPARRERRGRRAGPLAPLAARPLARRAARQGRCAPRPPLPRTKWTRRVFHPVLIGHAAPLTP
jgi:hypothetical protein